MSVRILLVAMLLLVQMVPGWSRSAEATELKFQHSQLANMFWIIDQVSQWDERYTNKEYRKYWEEKLALVEEDFDQLEKYARMRRRLAGLEGNEVRTKLSPWSAMFGRAATLPHEQFALAFFEMSTVDEVSAVLRLTPEDNGILMDTFRRFALKLKGSYGMETAHLKGFCEKAQILSSVADTGGFVGTLKSFLGITQALPQVIPVDVLWAPPGYFDPSHMQYHVLLPVSVEQAASDEAVLAHLSLALRETAAYLFSRVPADVLEKASSKLMNECGLIAPRNPTLPGQALLVALGEIMFLQEKFPDLPKKTLLVPFDPRLDVPHAVDTLAREFAVALKPMFNQAGGFYPGFVDKMAEAVKRHFPPRPRLFASTALVLAEGSGSAMFTGLFQGYDRQLFSGVQAADMAAKAGAMPNRHVFLVVTPTMDGAMWTVLKALGAPKQLAQDIKKVATKAAVVPVVRKNGAPVFIIRAPNDEGLRKALVWLHAAEALPTVVKVVD